MKLRIFYSKIYTNGNFYGLLSNRHYSKHVKLTKYSFKIIASVFGNFLNVQSMTKNRITENIGSEACKYLLLSHS